MSAHAILTHSRRIDELLKELASLCESRRALWANEVSEDRITPRDARPIFANPQFTQVVVDSALGQYLSLKNSAPNDFRDRTNCELTDLKMLEKCKGVKLT